MCSSDLGLGGKTLNDLLSGNVNPGDMSLGDLGRILGTGAATLGSVLGQQNIADKYDALLEWASDHLFEQFTTEQIVEISGFSYPTTLKFLQESPTFRKVKKGLWEVRDADADRKSEKS